MQIRCVTINLKGLEFGWFEGRSNLLIDGLRSLKPDLVCFQETSMQQGNPMYNQARVIGHSLGLDHCVFSPYGHHEEIISNYQGGIAIASHWQICDVIGRRLPTGHPSDARTSIFARLKMKGETLGVITTHLSWRPEELEIRLMQIGVILGDIAKHPWGEAEKHWILLGDLNATPDEPAIQIARETLKDAYTVMNARDAGYTWSSRNPFTQNINLPGRRIDYILCDQEAIVKKCEVILDQGPPFASDHFGVLADLEWKPRPHTKNL